jgi:6-phosphogluconolactonase
VFRLPSPSWLVWHPALPVLYAANEIDDGRVTALGASADGELTTLGEVSTGGAHPCHLALTPDARHLLCANYAGGSLAVLAVDGDGRLGNRTDLVRHEGSGPDPTRQEAAHVHMAVPGEDGSLVSAVDLGTDEIRTYRLAADGTLGSLAVSALPPGTGPRQLVRHAGAAYVAGELSGTVVTLREEPPGTFAVRDVTPATTPAHAGVPNLAAQLDIVDDRLYLSNRGPDCVTEFAIDDGLPRAVADHPAGTGPRHFTIIGGRCYVAAQHDDAVLAFPLDGGETVRYPVGSPVCVAPRPR